jgi:hypothetical protein
MLRLSTGEAQKFVALELVGSMGIIVLENARNGNFPGASQFVPPLIVFGGCAVLAGIPATATTATIIGLIVLTVQLTRPISGGTIPVGADIATGLGNLSQNIGQNAPTISKGHK